MAYSIEAGIQVSLDGKVWYKLTDHNRKEIQRTPTLIQKEDRMANGKLRKYVIAKKQSISTSWDFIPSSAGLTVDGNHSSAWLEAFYNANVGIPIYIKVVGAKDTVPSVGSYPNDSTHITAKNSYDLYQVYINSFSSTIVKRTSTGDFVNMSIEFIEV